MDALLGLLFCFMKVSERESTTPAPIPKWGWVGRRGGRRMVGTSVTNQFDYGPVPQRAGIQGYTRMCALPLPRMAFSSEKRVEGEGVWG